MSDKVERTEYAQLLYDFEASYADEMSCHAGDIVKVRPLQVFFITLYNTIKTVQNFFYTVILIVFDFHSMITLELFINKKILNIFLTKKNIHNCPNFY